MTVKGRRRQQGPVQKECANNAHDRGHPKQEAAQAPPEKDTHHFCLGPFMYNAQSQTFSLSQSRLCSNHNKKKRRRFAFVASCLQRHDDCCCAYGTQLFIAFFPSSHHCCGANVAVLGPRFFRFSHAQISVQMATATGKSNVPLSASFGNTIHFSSTFLLP